MKRAIQTSFPLLSLLAVGCPPPASQPAPPPRLEPDPAPAAAAEGWSELAPTTSDARIQRAAAARDALGGLLKKRLLAAIQEGGPVKAVAVCQETAPQIAREVRAETGVSVGRTSFRVRNPDNAPPAWTAPYVEERRATPLLLAGPQGSLRALYPLKLAPLCVNCHGDPATFSPELQAALGERYPSDQATGFSPGDLRGWFWVEVPGS